jgi:hypothetical protein
LTKEELVFDTVPRVIVYKDGRFYSYDSGFDRVDLMQHFVNRLLNPLVKLESEEEIIRFLGLTTDGPLDFWENDYNTNFLKQLGSKPDSAWS